MSYHTLLTGATGLLGRYLLRDLLRQDTPVAVLARAAGGMSAERRVEALVAGWEREAGRALPRPTVVAGDIVEPGLGLSARDRRWLALHCDRVLHSAASLQFVGPDRTGDPWRTNHTGTRHVAAVAAAADIRTFHYVSTAYVSGDRGGPIGEGDRDEGQGFRNDYEASKLATEQWLRARPEFDLTVSRPAVIVGDSATGFTSHYAGVYRFFQITWLMGQHAAKQADGRWHHPLRLPLAGHERRNLVPVDWVATAIVALLDRSPGGGTTYHLAPAVATTSADLVAALADYFRFHGVSLVGPAGLPPGSLTEYERGFYQYVTGQEAYLANEPQYDTTQTRRALPDLPCPPVDAACVCRLLDFAVRDRWGKAAPRRAAAVA